MNAAGESTLGKFEVYDCKFLFCPKCALEMYNYMKYNITKNKINKTGENKKTKIIKFEDIRKNR